MYTRKETDLIVSDYIIQLAEKNVNTMTNIVQLNIVKSSILFSVSSSV